MKESNKIYNKNVVKNMNDILDSNNIKNRSQSSAQRKREQSEEQNRS